MPAPTPAPTVLRHHEIAEAEHRILNPFTEEKLDLLGRVCRLHAGQRVLDLGCGKGEMLARWAKRHGVTGVGVDVSEVFLAAAEDRASELGVAGRVRFALGDASVYSPADGDGGFDIVACLGATWIGGGLTGTVELMRRAVKPGGLLLVGEPYWIDPPPAAAYEALDFGPSEFTSLAGTAERLASAGCELLEMVLADRDSFDRYAAGQWWALDAWLQRHPAGSQASTETAGVRDFLDRTRRAYLAYGRRYLGWGVFVTRPS
jgi:SAM-dependent methyltransferase